MKAIKGELQSLKKLQKQFIKERDRQEKLAFEKKVTIAKSEGKIPPLSPEDRQIFRQSLRGVVPLPDKNRIGHKAVPLKHPEFYKAKREQAEGELLLSPTKRTKTPHSRKIEPKRHEQQEPNTYLADGVGKDVLSKLKSLNWSVEATLDLHGATLDQATVRFDRFVSTCFEHQVRCFMVIHGKGHGSKGGEAVLKQNVLSWLRHLEHVIAFIPAPENLGGEGAVMVLCKG
ncbi:Smr/MutS family protein [Pelistega europaea]|uniref:Smr domain-containing protein n=1 Tax=Pelistega europaea TaxID=106147 RepID=A0A7Y4LB40_9BURK|nr:Smr/MutS family protein [Pelistega europaea]NOL50252.1 hypothetical protein [Pelistega europaea]